MPFNTRSFLMEMKRREQEKRKQTAPKNYSVTPASMRYLGNTGTGDDNILHVDKPTHIVFSQNGPVMLHEGEDVFQRNDNQITVIPASKSGSAAGRGISQEEMQRVEKDNNIPGYASGGSFSPSGSNSVFNPFQKTFTNTKSFIDNITSAKSKQQPQQENTWISPVSGAFGTMAKNLTDKLTNNVNNDKNVMSPLSNWMNKTSGNLIGQIKNQTAQPNTAPFGERSTVAVQSEPVVKQKPTMPQINPITVNPVAPITQPAQTIAPAQQLQAQQPIVNPVTVPQPPQQNYMQNYENALARLTSIMEGGSQAQKAAAQKAIDDMKKTMGVQQRVSGFEAAQQGLSPEAAAARQAIGRAAGASQLGQTEAQLAGEQMQSSEQAARDVANVGMAGAQTQSQLATEAQNRQINEQQEQGNQIDLERRQYELDQLKRTDAGSRFASYVDAHKTEWSSNPQAALSDPAFMSAAQEAWKTMGGTGQVPTDWAMNQVKSIYGASNQNVQLKATYDDLVNRGLMNREDADTLYQFETGGMVKYLKKDPATGKISFDYEGYQKDMGLPTYGQGIEEANVDKIPTNVKAGKSYIGTDGNIYTNDPDNPGSKIPADIPSITLDELRSNPQLEDAVKTALPSKNIEWNTLWGGLDDAQKQNTLVKFNIGGKEYVGTPLATTKIDGAKLRPIKLSDGSVINFKETSRYEAGLMGKPFDAANVIELVKDGKVTNLGTF